MKPRQALLLPLTVALLAPAARAQTIPNPSFEIDHYNVSPGYAAQNGGHITGWVISDTNHIGLNLGGTNNPGLFVDNGAIPDGTNVAFIQSNGTTNSLSTTISGLLPGALYQVRFRANSRSGYTAPGATWSLNGGAFVHFTCSPAVGGTSPYYTNTGSFTATSNTAPLVAQNWVTNIHDGTVLLDDFSVQILPQTLIQYRPNATDAGTVAGGSIPNLGTLGNGSNGGTGVTLTNDVPTGVVPGDQAIVCNGSGGILAPGTEQLNRTNISNAGGFTYETWFKWNGGGTNNVMIDYAGTEKLIRRSGDPGPTMETDNAYFNSIGLAAPNQWHYVAVVFTATNTVTASDSVSGFYTFYLDATTPVATVPDITINNFGDTLNRTIGVGMHPAGYASDYFNGLLYDPRVTLGALPASGLLFNSTYVVTNLADSGPGTLRSAVANSATSPIIHFDPSLSGHTILLTNGPIVLDNDVVIDASALTSGIEINGNASSRIFTVNGGVIAVLNSLTIANGNDNNDTTNGGGGIYVAGSSSVLKVNYCTFSGNQADSSQDGGGAIDDHGTLTVDNSTFSNNHADGAYPGGGGICLPGNSGSLSVNNSTFVGNHSNNGTLGGGGISTVQGVTLNSCTFTGNVATNGGWGGGGLLTLNVSATVINCTLTGNRGGNGGGIENISGQSYLTNCIVCSNTVIYTDINVNQYTGAGNLIDTNAQLAPLGNYGGPTQTMPPLPGSRAIDGGIDSGASGLTTDQRGYPRIAGTHVDIGAVEVQPPATNPAVLRNITRSAGGGTSAFQFTFTNTPDADFTVLTSTNVALPLANWTVLGEVLQPAPGQYQFTDLQAATNAVRFYQVRSP